MLQNAVQELPGVDVGAVPPYGEVQVLARGTPACAGDAYRVSCGHGLPCADRDVGEVSVNALHACVCDADVFAEVSVVSRCFDRPVHDAAYDARADGKVYAVVEVGPARDGMPAPSERGCDPVCFQWLVHGRCRGVRYAGRRLGDRCWHRHCGFCSRGLDWMEGDALGAGMLCDRCVWQEQQGQKREQPRHASPVRGHLPNPFSQRASLSCGSVSSSLLDRGMVATRRVCSPASAIPSASCC